MNLVNTCPCCSSSMLHHFKDHREYWFCRQCWQEMPNLSIIKSEKSAKNVIVNLSTNLSQYDSAIA